MFFTLCSQGRLEFGVTLCLSLSSARLIRVYQTHFTHTHVQQIVIHVCYVSGDVLYQLQHRIKVAQWLAQWSATNMVYIQNLVPQFSVTNAVPGSGTKDDPVLARAKDILFRTSKPH